MLKGSVLIFHLWIHRHYSSISLKLIYGESQDKVRHQRLKIRSTFIAEIGHSQHDSYEIAKTERRIQIFSEISWHLFNNRYAFLFVFIFHCHFEFYLLNDVVNQGIIDFAVLLIGEFLLNRNTTLRPHIHCLSLIQFRLSDQIIIKNISMLNLFSRSILTKAYGAYPLLAFGIANATDPDFKGLKQLFLKHKDMIVFNDLIKASNNTVDNINYFKIYQLLEENKADIKHFEDFFLQVDSTLTRKSDNIRMLLAKVKAHIAKQYEQQQNYYDAINSCEQALEVLEQSLIPPVMLYYQIYRYEGFIHHKLKNNKEAYDILEESVRMISKVIEHSEDHVNSNINCKNQAKACAILAELDPSNAQEWVSKCFDSWQDFQGNKYQLSQYAESIVAKAKLQVKRNPKKAEQLLTVSAYQFKVPELKDYLNTKKQELLKEA